MSRSSAGGRPPRSGLAQERGGPLTLEGPYDLGELGKDEDQETVELAQAISES